MSLRVRNTDEGATAVIVALSLIVLLGMAALAVDLGLGFNERRQDQSAADVGALAAAQFAKPVASAGCSGYSGQALARCNGAVAAMSVANATLDNPSASVWTSGAECVAPPGGFTVAPNTPCVAFNANLQRAWVHVPQVEVPTVFGRVLGMTQMNTSANAIAITTLGKPNKVLPFLTPGVSGAGDYDCLKTQGNHLNWNVCQDLPATGNFGSADYFIYGNEIDGSTERCTGDENGRLVYNIANGVDHPLSVHPTGSGGGIEEKPSCPIFSAEPNMLKGQPGVGSNLDTGLTRGGTANAVAPYDGRIEDGGGFLVRNAGGPNPATRLNNVPLWSYLVTGLNGPCNGVSTPDQMEACVNWAKSTGTIIFTEAIGDDPRFAFTALMWEDNFLTPGSDYRIKSFLPVYLDTTYYGCTNTGCAILHTPGMADSGACPPAPFRITCGTPGAHNKDLQAVTSYILAPGILPLSVRTPYPGSLNQRFFSLAE